MQTLLDRYEAIGSLVDKIVYSLLESLAGLKRIPLSQSGAFVFADFDGKLADGEKLLVLIHGSGVVRAGQWARRLIINDGLEEGTQLPYIKRATESGYKVLVTNTNLNKDQNGAEMEGSATPLEHSRTAWKR